MALETSDQFRQAIRVRQYSPQTEKSDWYWIRYFLRLHKLRQSSEMSEPEVSGCGGFWLRPFPQHQKCARARRTKKGRHPAP
ncbi:phage integrase N-terminal SAM-like domain-containing protein [Alloalcanivorax dieselolei]|uniref:phage integrase N-terminal SAM-like domain-containing protein n=1 Tax=Alloalcanivorax dieselolei TaxID=285091 RepID=UPI0009DAE969